MGIHSLPDVDCAAFCNKHRFEMLTTAKRVFGYFLQRTRKRDLLDSAVRDEGYISKAFASDVLNPIRDFNIFEAAAKHEGLCLESLQRGRKADALNPTVFNNESFYFHSVDDFLSPKRFQALVQLYAP